MNTRIISCLVGLLLLAGSAGPTHAQVTIPDPGLNAAVREALQKPVGPLTQSDLLSLDVLSACCRDIKNLQGLEAAQHLRILDLHSNSLTNSAVINSLTNLQIIDLFQNQLTSFVLPSVRLNLTIVDVAFNSLTQCSLPNGLANLDTLFLEGNQLTNFTLPAGLSRLTQLDLSGNQLTSLTLPPDMTRLITLGLDGNPITTFVLSKPLAATNLGAVVTTLQNQGVSVFTYPVDVQLVRPLMLIGAFKIGITGPPGVYSVLGSTNLATWSVVGVATNPFGSVSFHDVTASASPKKFYRALRQGPPTNMVFIAANTFTMGSPTNELHRNINEGPQTTVTLSRGFWIGKFEVTQGEYESVTGMNPSVFPGDPSRPVSSVSWPDATNYCAKLTEREMEAGRIPIGSQYRLPTEAEWECAARAGTTTRFSYGDDPDYSSLTNYAWLFHFGELTVIPVGQRLPNPWGLYDTYGNVWEWCQDWLGPLPGGTVTDPVGPDSNPIGWKIVRGGAYDFGESDCRSARRFFFPSHPALNDSDIGFRVVLVTPP